MTTAIIGGGAAGIAAAIAAAERGQRVLVLERNRKPLKKLGVTGNGRANVLNSGTPLYYGDEAFAKTVLARVGYAELRAFFTSLGVPLREETEGRLYPAALQASVVVEALLLRAAQLGVEWITGTRVDAIEHNGQGFTVRATQTAPEADERKGGKASKAAARGAQTAATSPLTLQADRVIVTVGGAAAPAHGTDGSAYGLLTAFGHRITTLKPALCALLTDPRRIAGLSGQRVKAGLALLAPDGHTLHAAEGEVLFGDDAISGIAAMQLARFYQAGASLSMDLRPATGWVENDAEPIAGTLPGKTFAVPAADGARQSAGASTNEVPSPEQTPIVKKAPDGAPEALTNTSLLKHLQALAALRRDCALGDLLTGTLAAPVARLLCREAKLGDPSMPVAQLRQNDLRRLAATLAELRLPITATRGWDQAQVTAGGIETADFDPATLESRLCKHLYAAGEVLNVDGDCGGFNLMFAFASGRLAGQAE